MRWRLRGRHGQGLVEFVLVMPILLLLFMGIVEFARAWNIRHVITDAAREGARNLAIANDQVDQDSVLTAIATALRASSLRPEIADIQLDDAGSVRGEPARVTIIYPYDLGVVRVLLGWAVPDGHLDIATTFVMRNE